VVKELVVISSENYKMIKRSLQYEPETMDIRRQIIFWKSLTNLYGSERIQESSANTTKNVKICQGAS